MADKNNLYLIGIVGVIAIVCIVVMIIGSANVGVYTPVVATINSAASNDNSISSSDTSGQAFIADTTPRIAYWSGKVNQHVNIATGVWATDPDGTSGATINMLTYCKKWYPRTTGYVAYKMETITTWRNGGNTGGPFTSTKQSYKCLQSVPVCGDGTCNSVESCSSCPGDCGTCPVSTCTGSANQSCSIANGAGTQSRTCTNGMWSLYGTCTVTTCNAGYILSGNTCIVASCSDSDGGLSYTIAGVMSYAGIKYPDYCRIKDVSSPNNIADAVSSCSTETNCYLVETYCNNPSMGSWTTYKCPNRCSNGACI